MRLFPREGGGSGEPRTGSQIFAAQVAHTLSCSFPGLCPRTESLTSGNLPHEQVGRDWPNTGVSGPKKDVQLEEHCRGW